VSLVLALVCGIIGGNLVDKEGVPAKATGLCLIAIAVFDLRVYLAPLGIVGTSLVIAAPVAAVVFLVLRYLHGSITGGEEVTSTT